MRTEIPVSCPQTGKHSNANKGRRDPVLQVPAPREGISAQMCDLGEEAACDNWVFLQSKPPLSPAFI